MTTPTDTRDTVLPRLAELEDLAAVIGLAVSADQPALDACDLAAALSCVDAACKRLEAFLGDPGDDNRVKRMSLIEESPDKEVCMAHLAIVGTHSTNGVAAIHMELLRTRTVKDFAEMFPERFSNKTNGVTPRRWLLLANPALAQLITEAIGDRASCN